VSCGSAVRARPGAAGRSDTVVVPP
jgi:hypothetical protein